MIPVPPADDPVFDPIDMDHTVDPGVDFYRFVNGGWLEANPVPPEYQRWAAFEEVTKANEVLLKQALEQAAADPGSPGSPTHWAGRFYAAGMDTSENESRGLEPVSGLLERCDAVRTSADLRALAADVRPFGIRLPLGFNVAPDYQDSRQYLVYLGQGGLGLPERDYYSRDDEKSIEIRGAYTDHVAAMLELGGLDDAKGAARAVVDLETALAEPSYTPTQQRDTDLIFNRYRADDLGDVMPAFGLPAYVESIGAHGLGDVNIDNPAFFAAADEILSGAGADVLKAYARWNVLRATASSLPARFEDEAFRFYGTVLGGQQRQKERWHRVLRAAGADIPQIIAQIYVASAFSPEAKTRAEALVGRLLGAMADAIDNVSWMSDATKSQARTKLEGFTYKIGYPDRWRDHTGLDLGDGPWSAMRIRARAFEFRRRLDRLHEPVDRDEWEMGAHQVNAYYSPLLNEIVFPAGILQPPFFDASADDAPNYGGIGSVIGHEITHGFDDLGSRFDADGKLRNWWTDEDRSEFDRRTSVIVEQFNEYSVLDDVAVNGELTLGENIADLGGVTIAYAAMQAALDSDDRATFGGLTPEQRFFMAYARLWRSNETDEFLRLRVNADPHSPARFRCNGALSNLEEFGQAFGLDEGSAMIRPTPMRAKVW